MPHPKSRARYPDVQEYLTRALETERGIRIECASEGKAHSLMMKVNAKKKDWRKTYIEMSKEAPEIYSVTDDPHQYIQPAKEQDPETGKWYVYLRRDNPYASGIILNIEEL